MESGDFMARRMGTIQQEVPALVAVLNRERPEGFGPDWIMRTDRRVYSRLYRRLNGDGWDGLANALPAEWRSRWHYQVQQKGISLAEEAKYLEQILERERPGTFSPYWITKKDETFYYRLKDKLRRANGVIEWGKLISLLSPEWRCHWLHKKPRRQWSATVVSQRLSVIARVLTVLLERERPESFGPKWISQQDRGFYDQIKKVIRKKKGSLDWLSLIGVLNLEWRLKWKPYRPPGRAPERRTLQLEVSCLASLLEELSPETFSAKWIRTHDAALYRRLRRCLNKSSGDWALIFDHLGNEWRSKWTRYAMPCGRSVNAVNVRNQSIRWRSRKTTSLEECVCDLEDLIKRLQPAVIGPGWIKRQYPGLYLRLRDRIRAENQKPDWRRVVALLHEPYQRMWREMRRLDRYLPAATYRNAAEADAILQKHADKMYTFVATAHEVDVANREVVCRELIRLAQRGNLCAVERLIALVYPLVSHWCLTEEHFRQLVCDPDVVKDKLRKCIYYFQEGEASFLRYVWKSLTYVAKTMNEYKTLSLDASLYGEKADGSLLDFIGLYDSGEPWRLAQ